MLKIVEMFYPLNLSTLTILLEFENDQINQSKNDYFKFSVLNFLLCHFSPLSRVERLWSEAYGTSPKLTCLPRMMR